MQPLLSFQPTANTPLLLFKAVLLFSIAMYIVFALVVIRQIDLMTKTVKTPLTPVLRMIGWGHLIASGVVWFIALVSL
jgi:hypothetical protein